MTGRQVASVTGVGTAANVRRALLKLVDTGLVIDRATPAATYYSANREHLLWPAVEVCLAARDELIRRMTMLRSIAPDGTGLWLYGSVARGASDASSDVDVCVVFLNDAPQALKDELENAVRTGIELWTGNRAEIVALERRDIHAMRTAGDPFIDSLEREAITVFGPVPAELGGTAV